MPVDTSPYLSSPDWCTLAIVDGPMNPSIARRNKVRQLVSKRKVLTPRPPHRTEPCHAIALGEGERENWCDSVGGGRGRPVGSPCSRDGF